MRCGYEWCEAFCERHGTEILVMNGESYSPAEELVRDLLAMVTVFSARLHGLRSQKNASDQPFLDLGKAKTRVL